jgi:hypothetical protein
LNVRLPSTLKFTEITALVPFSTATGDVTSLRRLFAFLCYGDITSISPLLQKVEGAENAPELLLDSAVVFEFHFLVRLGIEGGAGQVRHSDL